MPKLTARSRIFTASRSRSSARELLRVVDAGNGAHVGRHDHGTCDNGARERAPSDFIDSGDQRPSGLAKLSLDRLPPIPRPRLRSAYSAAPVSGTATRTFFSLMRVALPVRLRR